MALSGLGRARIVGTRMARLSTAVGRIELPYSRIAVRRSQRSRSMPLMARHGGSWNPTSSLIREEVPTGPTRLSRRPSKSSNEVAAERAEPLAVRHATESEGWCVALEPIQEAA